MGILTVLKAAEREAKSSNCASRLRGEGKLPAVFYGPGVEGAINIVLDYKDFKTAITTSEGNRTLYTLDIEEHGSSAVLLKDFQIDPMSRKVIHADFYKIDSNKPVVVEVPVILKGKPIGVEKGGMLQTGVRDIIVSTLPANAPAEIVIDVSKLDFGESIHMSTIEVAEGMTLIYASDQPVATVLAPKGIVSGDEGEAKEGETEAAE